MSEETKAGDRNSTQVAKEEAWKPPASKGKGGSKCPAYCSLCCGVLAFLLGVALIVLGVGGRGWVAGIVEDTVEDGLELDPSEESFLDVDQKQWDVKFWNVTNLYDVQMSGAKPLLQEHAVDMVEKEFRYDAELQDDGEAVEYWAHWTYKPANDDEDFKFRNQTVVTINGMYTGGLGRLQASETQLFASFSAGTMARVRDLFLNEAAALLQAMPLLMYPVYLGAAAQTAQGADALTTEQTPAQWGRRATVAEGMETFFTDAGNADVAATFAAPFEYSVEQAGLPATLPDAVSNYLWNSTSRYGFFTGTGIGAWLRFISGLGAGPEAAAADLPGFYGTFTNLTDVDSVDGVLRGVGVFLATVTNQANPAYLGVLANIVATSGGLTGDDLADFTSSPTWAKMGAQQYAAGTATTLMGVGDSILALGLSSAIVAGPEYARYQSVHATVEDPEDLESMTYSTAIAFLDTFGQPALTTQPAEESILVSTFLASGTSTCQGYAAQVNASQETLNPALELIFLAQSARLFQGDADATACWQTALGTMAASDTYAGSDLGATTFEPYSEYLGTHIPREYLFRGSVLGNIVDPQNPAFFDLRPDGTGTLNSGLFTRRTPQELLFGHPDVLLDLILATASPETLAILPDAYYGFLGESYTPDNIEEQRALYEGVDPSEYPYFLPRIFKLRTGKGNANDYARYLHWRNISTFVTREDIWSIPREDPAWATPTTIGDYGVGDKFNTFQMEHCPGIRDGDCDRDIQQEYTIWIPKAFRPATMQYLGDSRVKGIFTQRYTYTDAVFELSQENIEKFFAEDAFMLNMEPAASAAPVVITLPKQAKADDARRAQFDYVDNAGDFDAETEDIFLHIEPFTGLAVKANVRFQINFKIRAETINGGIYSGIFVNGGDPESPVTDLVWPFYWTDEGSEITDDDASSLKDGIYGTAELTETLKIVFLVLGPILVLLSLCCCCYSGKRLSES